MISIDTEAEGLGATDGMLVLTRKITEGITIGPNIRVVVLEIKGGQVRLGIEAPNSVQVHRDEVYEDLDRISRRH